MVSQLPPKLESWFYKLGTNNSSQIATAILAGFKMFFIPLATIKDKKATPEQKRYTATRDVITEALAISLYTGVTGLAQKSLTAPICKKYFSKKAKMIEQGKIKGLDKDILSADELKTLKNINPKYLQEVGMQKLSTSIDKNGALVSKFEASPEAKKHISDVEQIVGKLQNSWKELPQNNVFQKVKNAFSNQSKIQAPLDAFKNTRINISQVSIWVLALSVIPAFCNVIITPVMKKMNKISDNKKETALDKNNVSGNIKTINNDVKNNNVAFKGYHNTFRNYGNMRVG